MNKKETLAKFLEVEVDDIEESTYDENTLCLGDDDYLVLTDEEADERAKEQIIESIWAFNSWFIVDHTPEGIESDVVEIMQEKCEGSNEAFKRMIVDLDAFVDDAICADGRGHFISSYDGKENEEGDYFIYRQ